MRSRLFSLSVGLAGLVILVAALSGCSSQPIVEVEQVSPSAALLFGGDDLAYRGTDVGRSDWPSVPAGYRSIDSTYYREYLYDYQGNYPSYFNFYQRRFYGVRVGAAFR